MLHHNKCDAYADSFINAIARAPTVFHWIEDSCNTLEANGFVRLNEWEPWSSSLHPGGKYYVTRNGSALLAFTLPPNFDKKDEITGCGIIGCHADANCLKMKPISKKDHVDGYASLGVAPCGGPLPYTWRDRDLGLGGRVLVRTSKNIIEKRLVVLDGPIGKIHFMANLPEEETGNLETHYVPLIGKDLASDDEATDDERRSPLFGKHELSLIRAVAAKLDVKCSQIIQWELEMFDTQPGIRMGLNRELVSCPRLDDKLCSYAAIEALMLDDSHSSTGVNFAAIYDNEETGSLTRQGARSDFLIATIERIFVNQGKDYIARILANSFIVSSDVAHATNPNFTDCYMDGHKPQLNVGVVLKIDPNGRYTTDGESATFIQEIARNTGNILQPFQVRNGFPSGSTIGPFVSTSTGIQCVDVGIPQLCMHSVRAMTGSKDIYLGIKLFHAFFRHWDQQRLKTAIS